MPLASGAERAERHQQRRPCTISFAGERPAGVCAHAQRDYTAPRAAEGWPRSATSARAFCRSGAAASSPVGGGALAAHHGNGAAPATPRSASFAFVMARLLKRSSVSASALGQRSVRGHLSSCSRACDMATPRSAPRQGKSMLCILSTQVVFVSRMRVEHCRVTIDARLNVWEETLGVFAQRMREAARQHARNATKMQ